MIKRLDRGFTLIELLVVIAIIGILSSVVLASLNTARGKGANAAIKSNLANVRAQAELVYDTASPNSYNTVCNATQDTNIAKAMAGAMSAAAATATSTTNGTAGDISTVMCHSDATAWAISSPLRVAEGTNLYWCVDSTGVSAGRVSVLAASSEACPAS